jgi:hypothetical protein
VFCLTEPFCYRNFFLESEKILASPPRLYLLFDLVPLAKRIIEVGCIEFYMSFSNTFEFIPALPNFSTFFKKPRDFRKSF